MKKSLLTLAMAGLTSLAGAAVITVTGPFNTDQHWLNTNTYVLSGIVYVRPPATLTIDKGTLIQGEFASKGSLCIEAGAKIMAIGTQAKPIVFTSEQGPGQRQRGDWGGVILLGHSLTNAPGGTQVIEGGLDPAEATFGGTDPHDNSGVCQYVRSEFAGIAFAPNNEINGWTFGGVGDGTTIDHIQVSYANDDSFEWFGGTVNCKYLIALRGIDDDWDTDNGFSGHVQFCASLRDPAVADISGSKAFESDNDATGDNNLPQTNCAFCNMTCCGPNVTPSTVYDAVNFKYGAHVRRNSAHDLFNSLVMGWPEGLHIDGAACDSNAVHNQLEWKSNTLSGILGGNYYKANSGDLYDVTAYAAAQGGNFELTNNTDVQLTDPFNLTNPNWHPIAGSPALTEGTDYTSPQAANAWFTHVSYRGAFGQNDTWADCWTNFTPVNTAYPQSTPINLGPTVTITGTASYCDSTLLTANVNQPVSYQWQLNTVNIPGATNSTVYAKSSGAYKVIVTNSRGCIAVVSKTVSKKPNPTKPLIRASCNTSGQTIFSVAGTYSSFQWKRNGFNVPGATTRSTIPTLPGNYTVRVTGTNGCANLTATRAYPLNPAVPTTQLRADRCSRLNYSLSHDTVPCDPVVGATGYLFKFYDTATPAVLYAKKQKTGVNCRLAEPVPALLVGHTYNVTVQAQVAGDTACAGTVCTIGIPTAISQGDGGQHSMISATDEGTIDVMSVYPNPTEGNITNIYFTLVKDAQVSVDVYDINGKFIVNAVNGDFVGGVNGIEFNTSEFAPGLYTIRLAADGVMKGTERLTIIR